jgi:hypothetical protein
MEPIVKRTSASRVELFDAHGRLIGSIERPVGDEILGPGREKVYLARRDGRTERTSQAA